MEMENGIAEYEATLENAITPFKDAWEEASIYAASDMVPAHFKKPENCYVAFRIAERMGTDLFMLMQNLYQVHGKIGIEAKFAIAMFNASGAFDDLQYVFSGTGDKWACRCEAKRKSTGETVTGPTVSIEMAKAEGWYSKSGSKWKTMPEMMLRYRAAMFFIRTNCPQVLLGMHSKDELRDGAVEVEPVGDAVTVPEGPGITSARATENLSSLSSAGMSVADLAKPEPKKKQAEKFVPPRVCVNTACPSLDKEGRFLSGCADTNPMCKDPNSPFVGECKLFVQGNANAIGSAIDKDLMQAAKKELGWSHDVVEQEERWAVTLKVKEMGGAK